MQERNDFRTFQGISCKSLKWENYRITDIWQLFAMNGSIYNVRPQEQWLFFVVVDGSNVDISKNDFYIKAPVKTFHLPVSLWSYKQVKEPSTVW